MFMTKNCKILMEEMRQQKEEQEKEKFKKDNCNKDNDKESIDDELLKNKIKKKAVKEKYDNFLVDIKEYLLEEFIYEISSKSMQKVELNVNKSFLKSLIHEYVQTNGVYNIIDKMKSKNTLFLSESVDFLETYYNIIKENSGKEDEVFEVDPCNMEDFYCDLKNESIENISDIIGRRVSKATEEFMNKNIVDDINIKDILSDTKEKIDNITGVDKDTKEEIKLEYTNRMKRNIKNIEKRPKSIFEQIVYNMSDSIIKNDNIFLEYCTEEGRLDMEKIVSKSKTVYTFFEMLNTTKIEDFNRDNILNIITIE